MTATPNEQTSHWPEGVKGAERRCYDGLNEPGKIFRSFLCDLLLRPRLALTLLLDAV